jgi:Xaa-Pro aminopeptidase
MKNGEMASLWEDQQRISKDPWERSKMEKCGRQINAAHQQMREKKKQISQTAKEELLNSVGN